MKNPTLELFGRMQRQRHRHHPWRLMLGQTTLESEFPGYINSVMDRRIFAQVARLGIAYPRRTFLIEGNLLETQSAMAPEAIVGAVSYLSAIEGATVLQVGTVQDSAKYLITMARHLQDGLGYEVALRGAKPKPAHDLAQYLVEGLPGIGPSTARALLAHFGSAAAVFNAQVGELCAVQGVGKKTAERLREALEWGGRRVAQVRLAPPSAMRAGRWGCMID